MTPEYLPASRLPEALREDAIHPRIAGLWYVGSDPVGLVPRVAIVGSRASTSYGLEMARTIAADLARAGIVVVSGMARGIDSAAHRGALSVRGGRTIAVLAGGADVPYPRSSAELYPRIVENGAVVSEEPPGADHRPENFLKRNRIIAAISLGVVLVQADAQRSGALTTMRWARTLHREIFAVPGDVRSSLSDGPHAQLRAAGNLCRGAQDVIEDLELALRTTIKQAMEVPPGLDERETAVIRAVNGGPAGVDELAARAGLPATTGMRLLTRLEIAGFVVREGGTYRRAR